MTVWSDSAVDLLKTLWESGISAQMISVHFPGATRNSVIGKAHRLGLPPKKTKTSQPRIVRKMRECIVKEIPLRKVYLEPEPPIGESIPFMQANSRTCRAIMGKDDDGLALFCSNPKDPEMSFCLYHYGIFYVKKSA